MSAAIGWVEESWSCRYAQVFSMLAKVVQAEVQRVACDWQSTETKVANDSFSQRSSHQRMVTRSPNHMCAISCRIVPARFSWAASVTRDRKIIPSLKVMHPGF